MREWGETETVSLEALITRELGETETVSLDAPGAIAPSPIVVLMF
jgi:hypothetical protein